jgi:hypothetical protein
MSKRTYPRVGHERKLRPTQRPMCGAKICANVATLRFDIQVSWFRGDDECVNLCAEHAKQVRAGAFGCVFANSGT